MIGPTILEAYPGHERKIQKNGRLKQGFLLNRQPIRIADKRRRRFDRARTQDEFVRRRTDGIETMLLRRVAFAMSDLFAVRRFQVPVPNCRHYFSNIRISWVECCGAQSAPCDKYGIRRSRFPNFLLRHFLGGSSAPWLDVTTSDCVALMTSRAQRAIAQRGLRP
jgi:hypothetical protein